MIYSEKRVKAELLLTVNGALTVANHSEYAAVRQFV